MGHKRKNPGQWVIKQKKSNVMCHKKSSIIGHKRKNPGSWVIKGKIQGHGFRAYVGPSTFPHEAT